MCHQTVGLIARQLEAAGISTVSLTSARDITLASNPPRSAFLDFPLGHTAGKVGEPELNKRIVSEALSCLESDTPGTILDLAHRWAGDDTWKHDVMRVDVSPSGEATSIDERRPRADSPQYQCEADRLAAASTDRAETDSVEPGLDY